MKFGGSMGIEQTSVEPDHVPSTVVHSVLRSTGSKVMGKGTALSTIAAGTLHCRSGNAIAAELSVK